MIRNYFKIAFRNLTRNGNYTMINIAGLAAGIAVCLMIFLIIQFHTGFDNFHAKEDQIYRVVTEGHNADASTVTLRKNVPFMLPVALKTAFPELEEVAPVYSSRNDELQVFNNSGAPVGTFKESSGIFYTSPSFFRIFDFPLLAGTHSSLADPNNVLLTKETAEKYFGDWRSAMGQTVKLTGTYRIGSGLFQFPPLALKVSGILATVPANSDFQMKAVIAWGTDFTGDPEYGFQKPSWGLTAPDHSCYVLLPEKVSVSAFNQQLRAYAAKAQPANLKDSYRLQSLGEIHYDTEAGNLSNRTISRELVNVLWLIASFILLIACVNFINLSTAQAVNRSKEVGVRKVLGSSRYQLQCQFLVETFLIVICAVLLATVITVISMPYVQRLLDISISQKVWSNMSVLLFGAMVTIVVTLLAGFYPSVVLSRFNPVNALKAKLVAGGTKGVSLRRGLVVFQFIIAQGLIIGTLIMLQQMDYFMQKPLGFDKDAVVSIPFRPDSTGGRLTAYLKQQLMSVKGVQSVSFCSNTPMDDGDEMWTSFRFNKASRDADFQAILKFADQEYVPAYKLKLIAGRNLQPSDMTKEFLVNESFTKSLGFNNPADILNKEVSIWDDLVKCTVVGVLKDFNARPFQHGLAPLIMTTNSTMYRQVSVKLGTTDMSGSMAAIGEIWKKAFPDRVYEFRFLDEKIGSFYKQENQLAQLYKIFAAISIFLSCLGLYGLASFMAVQRTKEVGIRKVLGASTGNIVYLFSREFVILIAIAFVIATPIAWYYMHRWLQDYAYRIDVSWWLFALAGISAVLIALATISFQAVKAARANPIRSLRAE